MSTSKREISRTPARKTLQTDQLSSIQIVNIETGDVRTVREFDQLVESPNWTSDGKWLIVNSGGKLWRLASDGSSDLIEIPTGRVQDCNNDHVLSPDNKRIYISALGHLYELPFEGGEPRQISNDRPSSGYLYYLHGISPDAKTLVYTAVEPYGDNPRGRLNIATIPASGGDDCWVVNTLALSDGPEYTPDGQWIYFNSEFAAKQPGQAQIFRIAVEGGAIEQITFDERVNWFPHFSPNGKWMAYISYEPGTISHPADVDVELRLMPTDGGESKVAVKIFGGQGSFNVNSWAPDNKHFAYVAYPFID